MLSHLYNTASVLCYRQVHIGRRTRSPHWPHIQQVLPGAFNQLLVLDAHPCQHHALRPVVVAQVVVKHFLVNRIHVVYRTKTRQSNRVASIRSLETGKQPVTIM